MRGFFNVCRHHAAAVLTAPMAQLPPPLPLSRLDLRLEGTLRTPEWRASNFDVGERSGPGPVGDWGAGCLSSRQRRTVLADFWRRSNRTHRALDLNSIRWFERRITSLMQLESLRRQLPRRRLPRAAHARGLDSVLDYSNYTIENGDRFCLQSSPIGQKGEAQDRRGAQGRAR